MRIVIRDLIFTCPCAGTNENEAKKLIAGSDLRIITCDDLDDAAIKAVQLSQIVKLSREAKVDVSFQLTE